MAASELRKRLNGGGIPAYAGMTVVGGNDGHGGALRLPTAVPSPAAFAASSRERWTRDSRLRGNDGTRGGNDGIEGGNDGHGGALRLPTAVPSPAAFVASSPLLGRGGYEIPAYAGMTVMGSP